MAAIDDLKTAVTNNTTEVAAAVAAINGSGTAALNAEIAAAATQINTNTQALATALTPATPTPPVA